MVKKILQINFVYEIPAVKLLRAFMDSAKHIADVKGLEWKIWIHNSKEKIAGGIYLFKDTMSVKDYLNSKTLADLLSSPALKDIEVKVFDVLPVLSKITEAPI